MVGAETTITLRVPTELFDSVKEIAEEDSCSLSSVVRRACLKYINDRKNAKHRRLERIPIDDGE